MTPCRELFEKWVQDDKPPMSIARGPTHGEYMDDDVQHCWEVWQASAVAMTEHCLANYLPMTSAEVHIIERYVK